MPIQTTEPQYSGARCESCDMLFDFVEADEYVHRTDLIEMEISGWVVHNLDDDPDTMLFYCPKHNPERKKAKGKKHRTKGGK